MSITTIIQNFLKKWRTASVESLGDLRDQLEKDLRAGLDAADRAVAETLDRNKAAIDAAQAKANAALDAAQTRAAEKAAQADAVYAAGREFIKDKVDAEIDGIEQTIKSAIRRLENLQTAGVAQKGDQEEAIARLKLLLAAAEDI